MHSPKISIIIPVFNAEKYLHRCVNSILAQTYQDFEILLIDDGSSDRSGEICDQFAKLDNRIRVFHKENGGVSSARNWGLKKASGCWIAFVDSDDYVKENFLQSIILSRNEQEIIHFGFCKEMSNGHKYPYFVFEGNKRISVEEFFSKKIFSSCSVSYFFPKLLLKDIWFNEKIHYSEDREFIIKVILLSENKIQLAQNTEYIYTYNPNGATNNRKQGHYSDDLIALLNIAKFIKEHNLNVKDAIIKYIYKLFINSFFYVLGSCGAYNDIGKYKYTIKKINKLIKIRDLDTYIFYIIPQVIIFKYKLYIWLRTIYHRYK